MKICLKIKKGEGSQLWARAAQGAQAPDVRSNLPPLLRPPPTSAPRPRERGFIPSWGKELQSCAPGPPTAPGRVPGESHPRAVPSGPPARAAPLSESGDEPLLCRVPTPFPGSPLNAPEGSALHSRLPGRPQKTEGTQLAPAIPPHFNSLGLGPLTAAPAADAARALALKPDSLGEPRGPFISSRQPKRRSVSGSDSDSGLGLANPARVNVNFANQAFPKACASFRSAPSPSSPLGLPQLCRVTGG